MGLFRAGDRALFKRGAGNRDDRLPAPWREAARRARTDQLPGTQPRVEAARRAGGAVSRYVTKKLFKSLSFFFLTLPFLHPNHSLCSFFIRSSFVLTSIKQ